MRTYLPLFFLALGHLTVGVSATNGTCISSPQSACTSLVAICVSKVATGQVRILVLPLPFTEYPHNRLLQTIFGLLQNVSRLLRVLVYVDRRQFDLD